MTKTTTTKKIVVEKPLNKLMDDFNEIMDNYLTEDFYNNKNNNEELIDYCENYKNVIDSIMNINRIFQNNENIKTKN